MVFKYGISIDLDRIEAIKKIPPLKDKGSLRSFFGKINIVRRFVPNFAEIIKPLNNLLKKDVPYTWDVTKNSSFEEIKERIASVSVLACPDYTKDFIIYSFASKDNIAGILMQKYDQGRD